MKKHLSFLLLVLVAATLLGIAAGCGGSTPIPSAPQILVTTEKDYRAVEMKTLGILQTIGSLVDQASQLEAAAGPSLPPDVHARIKAGFVTTANKGLALIQDIDAHALSNWAQLKARLDPILADIEALRQLVTPAGPSKWAAIVEAVANIAGSLLMPGVVR
jgi:hypothetical protein